MFCGATIVSSKFAISAAHCFHDIKRNTWIRSGRVELLSAIHDVTLDYSVSPRHGIANIYVHPKYDPSTEANDIALIEVRDQFDLSTSDVRPVCLPAFANANYVGRTAKVIGWGDVNNAGQDSPVLMEVDVTVVNDCGKHKKETLTEGNLCAIGNEKDACEGDSGGPLVIENLGRFVLVGIVSWGTDKGCAVEGYAGVYTKVTHFLRWIKTVISNPGGHVLNRGTMYGRAERRIPSGDPTAFSDYYTYYAYYNPVQEENFEGRKRNRNAIAFVI